MSIAVLGAGPSGLFAAHAAHQCGYDVEIFDKSPNMSRRNSGVFFIHDDCDLLLDSVSIKQTVLGCYGKTSEEVAELYGKKVYGRPIAKTSVMDVLKNPVITGYNSGQALNRLWDMYGNKVIVKEINPIEVLDLLDSYEKVVSTIPAYILYPNNQYDHGESWIRIGKSPENEAFLFYDINPNQIWYRCSAMFGVFVQEFRHGYIPDMTDGYEYRKVIKVIGDGIQSDIPNLFLVGRYGAWDKKCLTHNVYEKTLDWLLRNNE